MAVVVELKLTVLKDFEIVPDTISFLDDLILLHLRELDCSCDRSFSANVIHTTACLLDDHPTNVLLFIVDLLVTFNRLVIHACYLRYALSDLESLSCGYLGEVVVDCIILSLLLVGVIGVIEEILLLLSLVPPFA